MTLRLRPLLAQLTIQDKKLRTMRFPYNPKSGVFGGEYAWAQDPYIAAIEDQYNTGRPVRTIVLKSRQLGFSTVSEAVMFSWMFLHPGCEGMVLANETDTSEALFNKTKLFWETWPGAADYRLKYATKQNMHWLETGSQLKIATAGNRMTGRGHTFHAVHLSEVAFYPDPKRLMLGLQQSVPEQHGTIMMLESTANGIGNYFYTMWQQAVEHESDFVPLFFPWWRHPEYRLPDTRLSTPLECDADEKHLLRLMRDAGYKDPLAYRHLAWRRWMLKNKVSDLEEFMQEYPSEPEEAFRTSGTPVFPHSKVKECFHNRETCACKGGSPGYLIENIQRGVRFVKDRSGPFTIFKHPSRTDRSPLRYFLAADPSETTYGDPSSIQIINRATNEQVACYSNRCDPRQLAGDIITAGIYYNACMVCPEAEGGGQACIAAILERDYPNVWLHTWADKSPGKKSTSYGWSMNYNRKKWCVGMLQNLFINKEILIHDTQTYHQLLDYAHWGEGIDMGNASPDGHDDAVMALGIAVTASATEPAYIPDHLKRMNPVFDIYSSGLNEALDGTTEEYG